MTQLPSAAAGAAQPPLWRQLQAVSQVVLAIQQGTSGTAALAQVTTELRPGVQALTFQVLRAWGRAQAVCRLLVSRPPPPASQALLCTALALLLSEAAQGARYDVFTLVNQAVEAAKKASSTRPQANFLNACLRRFLREREALVSATDALPEARWNHPAWWIERLRRDWPEHWQAILLANQHAAPMTLRVNARQSDVASYLMRLQVAGLDGDAVGPCGVTLRQAKPVTALPGFAQGMVSVQDPAAQMAAPLLLTGLTGPGRLRVLDACAAPGGKTAHLLELADCDLTALDLDPLRCERIHQTLQRLGLQARVLVADAAALSSWWDGQPFDGILLDAPCSASGIVRRHPDVPWLRRPTDIAQLAVIQQRLLAALWPALRPGGRLLYSTCSVFRDEGQKQIETFLVNNTQARLLPSPGHLLPVSAVVAGSVPDNRGGEHDGFYYALLEKQPG